MRLSLTLAALERLIGGDTEIELQLRHQVLEQFAKNHLKALINTEAFAAMTRMWSDDVAKQVKAAIKEIQTEPGREKNVEADAACSIRNHNGLRFTVERIIKETIEKTVTDKLNEHRKHIESEVERRVSATVTASIATQVTAGIQKQLKLAAELAAK